MQPGIVSQAGQELDAGRAVLGQDQGPDHAPQGIAPIEDGQVPTAGDPGLFPDQFDRQFALGPK
jgi:hypothetical protein